MRVIITGANRGIGAGLAEAYRAQGAEIVAAARSATGAAQLDVTDTASINRFAKAQSAAPIDLLICNAGVYLDKGHQFESGYAADLWAQSFQVNVTGVFLTIQALMPGLRQAKASKIVIISSKMGSSTRAPGGSYIYRASKAAVLNLGRNLSTGLKPEGIAVGIYHPGWVRTDMGGVEADIDLGQSVSGLMNRIDALSIDTTGCFEGWDGETLRY